MPSSPAPRAFHSRILPVSIATACWLGSAAFAIDYTVTTNTDNGPFLTGSGSGTSGDLRYCIAQANLNPGSNILFATGSNPTRQMPPITAGMTIYHPQWINVTGSGDQRIFFIDAPGATVTLRNLELQNGRAKGGDGGPGAGGGAGLGGTVFVNNGHLVVDNVIFANTRAIGGNGGNASEGAPGGGGGLGGNGGGNVGGGGGFLGNGGNGGNGISGQLGLAGGGGGGIAGNGANGVTSNTFGGGGGGGTTSATNYLGAGGGGNGGSNRGNFGSGINGSDGVNGGLFGGGGGSGKIAGIGVGGAGGKYGGGGGGCDNISSGGGQGGEFGGGGAGGFNGSGGHGGFGGGGGAVLSEGQGGNAGFGGGGGSQSRNGGHGGSAFGGAIFVRGIIGASLEVRNSSLPAASITAGSGGTGFISGSAGLSAGSSLYLLGGTIRFNAQTDQTVGGSIATPAGNGVDLIKDGNGTLTLAAANTYAGGTTVNYGTLRLAPGANLGSTANYLATWLSGTCDLNGTSQTVNQLFGTNGGSIINNAPGTTSLLTFGNGNASAEFEGFLRDGAGKLALRKVGTGTQVLYHANTHTGPTEVYGGTLVLDTSFSNGPLIPAASPLLIANATVRLRGSAYNALGQGPVNLYQGGTLSAESTSQNAHTLGLLNLEGGTLTGVNPDPQFGNFILGNTVSASGNSTSTISAPVVQIRGQRTFDVANGSAPTDLTISSLLTDHAATPGGLIKTGNGTLALTGPGTYSGGTTINAGTLVAARGGYTGPFAAGSTVTVNNGGTLLCAGGDSLGYFDGNAKVVINTGGTVTTDGQTGTFTWLNDLTLAGGTLTSPSSGGVFLLAGPVKTLASGTTATISSQGIAIYGGYSAPTSFHVASGTTSGGIDLHVSSPIGGGGGEPLIKSGSGTMLISRASSYQGGTRLEGGTLAFSHPDALGIGNITFTLGTLRFVGITPDISSRINPTTASGFAIRIDTNGQNLTFASPLGGLGALAKSGAGKLTLSGISTYSGGTNVTAGTLAVTATGRLGSGPINIASGATLDLTAFGPAGYPLPAASPITNNGTILGTYYIVGTPPDISLEQPAGTPLVSGGSTGFSTLPVGSAEVKTFTIRNTATGSLQLTGVNVAGTHPGDFTVSTSAMTPFLSATAGNTATTFTVTFSPLGHGPRSAVLRVLSSDPDEGVIEINLTATGRILPELSLELADGSQVSDRLVAGWGANEFGQRSAPPGLVGATAISAGQFHSLAIRVDRSVAAWGNNSDSRATVPAGLGRVNAIAAGAHHSMALRQDGSVAAWGNNQQGQCNVPPGLGGVIAIAAGEMNSVALKSDGSVVAWGWNDRGQSNVPVGLAGVTAISAGTEHVLALKADGSVTAWGASTYGQATIPPGIAGVRAVAAGTFHSAVLLADGSVRAWGMNFSGQCDVPAGLGDVVAIAAGETSTLALKSDGSLVAWGLNSSGQITIPNLAKGFTAVATGRTHTLALHQTAHTFGSADVSRSVTRTFIVRNLGVEPLVVSGASIVGDHAGDFTLGSFPLPATLGGSGQASLSLTFTPGASGSRLAKLRLLSNDADEGYLEIPLTGTGVANALASWRRDLFGSTANSGAGADDSDPDRDGLVNLVEFAFGLHPLQPGGSGLPTPLIGGGSITYQFNPPVSATGVTYGVEWSPTLAPGSWTAIPDTGVSPQRRFTIPTAGRTKMFTRLVVTAP